MQNAMRAVNQALGRVIRHRNDYGAVLLADARFGGMRNMLSTWLKPHIKQHGGFSDSMSRCGLCGVRRTAAGPDS